MKFNPGDKVIIMHHSEESKGVIIKCTTPGSQQLPSNHLIYYLVRYDNKSYGDEREQVFWEAMMRLDIEETREYKISNILN